jgi:hypothetical protein
MRSRLLVVAALAAAAVGAGPVSASVAAKPDGCKVLKASEVTRITGFTAKKIALGGGSQGAGGCAYALDDLAPHTVTLIVQKNGGEDSKIAYRTAKTVFKDQIEPVSGLGRSAFYAGGGIDTLYVLKGGTYVSVQYTALGDADQARIKADVVAMTRIALSRV